MDKIVTKSHEVSVDTNRIIHIKVLEGAHIDPKVLQQLIKNSQKLAGRKKVLALVDARHFHTLTPEATNYLKTGVVDKTRIASAIVSNQVGIRFMVDFMTNVQKAKSPVRMFSSEARARAWLLSFKKNTPAKKPGRS